MIIVTGATHGIGRACAQTLALSGKRVLATGRDVAAGAELAAESPFITFMKGDVTSQDDCKRIVDRAV